DLERDLAPWSLSEGRPIDTPAAGNRVEFRADENRRRSRWNCRQAGVVKDAAHTLPRPGGIPILGQVIKERQRVRLSTAELRGEVEDGRCLHLHAGKASNNLCRELAEILRQEGALEELGGVLVYGWRSTVPNVIEMDREFRRVERLPV